MNSFFTFYTLKNKVLDLARKVLIGALLGACIVTALGVLI